MIRYLAAFLFLFASAAAQEIALEGISGVEVRNGDGEPSEEDGTNFGEVGTGQEKVVLFTVRNVSGSELKLPRPVVGDGDAGDFNVAFESGADEELIAPAGTVRFSVGFVPVQRGRRLAEITLGAAEQFTFAVGGVGVLPAQIAVFSRPGNVAEFMPFEAGEAPSSGAGTLFPQTITGRSSLSVFQIRNVGELDLTQDVVVSGAGFRLINRAFSPGAGLVREFGVGFSPDLGGVFTGTVTITSNDPDRSPFVFAVQGEGNNSPRFTVAGRSFTDRFQRIASGAEASVSNGTVFATEPGEALTREFRISNLLRDGNDGLGLTYSAVVDSPHFEITGLDAPLLADVQDDEFEIRYLGGQAGPVSAVVTFTTNDPAAETFSMLLEVKEPFSEILVEGGVGRGMDLELLPVMPGSAVAELQNGTDLGGVTFMGGRERFVLLVKSVGTGALEIGRVEVVPGEGASDGEFQVGQVSQPLDPEFSTGLDVTFEPQDLGVSNAVVRITTNSATTPVFTFAVRAEGIVPDEAELAFFRKDGRRVFPSAAQQLLGRGLVVGDAPARETFVLRNLGRAQVAGIVVEGSTPMLSFSPVPAVLAGTSEIEVTVELAAGAPSGGFTVTGDGVGDEPFRLLFLAAQFEEQISVAEVALDPEGNLALVLENVIDNYEPSVEMSRDLVEWEPAEVVDAPRLEEGRYLMSVRRPEGGARVFFRSSATFEP